MSDFITAQGFDTEVDKASFIASQFISWDGMRDLAKASWSETEAYRYATDTHSLPDGSAFSHSTHMPVVAAIAQDLEAILKQVTTPHEDYFTFKPMDLEAAALDQRDKIVGYLKSRFAVNGYESELAKLRSDLVTYGNCFSHTVFVDESVGDKPGYIGPKTMRISPYDIVFDPTASSFDATAKIIREVVSLGELKKRGVSELLDPLAVDSLLENKATYKPTRYGRDKDAQYVPQGFGSLEDYMTSGYVELLWFYGSVYDQDSGEIHENKVIVVAEGTHLLMDEDIATYDGQANIFHSVWQKQPDNLYGISPLANIIGINWQINHRENAKSEALDRLIKPDVVHLGDVVEVFDDKTGQTTYIAPEGGGVQELAVNTQFFSFDLQIDRLTHAARAAARLPSDLTGFRSQGEKTLGEVTALTDGGMRGFIDKAADFERTSLERHLSASIQLAKDNFTTAFSIPSQGDSGFLDMLEITKEDLSVNGILIPQGARRFARKNQILATLTQLSATPLAQVIGMHISGKGGSKFVEELLELHGEGIFSEYAQILEQAEAQQIANKAEQQVAADSQQPTQDELAMQSAIDQATIGN